MNSLIALLHAESIKLRRSLILGLALLFPLGLLVVSTLALALIVKPGEGASWKGWMMVSLIPWASFLLPMLTCLLATLLLNLEHQNHQWKHLNALPVSRWKHVAVKQVTLGLLLLLAHLLLLAGFLLGGWVMNLARPVLHLGAPKLSLACGLLGILFVGSWAMAGAHIWLASRFSHLGVNLGFGMIGIALIAVVSQRPAMARCLPWAMPMMGLTDWMGGPESASPWIVMTISVVLGTLLLALACWDAQKRETAG